ncbi:MAG: putative multiple sugar transport system substrate-binding protein [Microbacteriaceae bacterium]|jgi:putative multiple sugar transport system substrate-binding protein|nr:putative multiple sugar transport system substrate-binding protein [Microbacteriaceae bacterium]MDQ1553446.1 putative multiple sugar transport system substrate-binding protein [Microbacteriaceae bacterium]
MRKIAITTVALAGVALLALSGCSTRAATPGSSGAAAGFKAGSSIGVALPDKTSENWVLAGKLFEDGLAKAGFKADVQYAPATNTAAEQANQVSAMITKGDKVVVIGAKDGKQLGPQTAAAAANGTKVIAYDRLIEDTKNVDYYVAYDNEKVGELQGKALLDGLAARFPGVKPWNIELFSGSPDDANAPVFFNGAMKVLQPKIDDGTLKVVSGQTAIKATATAGWLAQNAQTRMDTLLAGNYSSAALNGVLSPNDTLARAIITSIHAAGKDTPTQPVVTGQDSEKASIPLIMSGVQYSTINKDTTKLVAQTIKMIQDLAAGKTPPTNSTAYNNGVKVVPTYLLPPELVTKDNAAKSYANDPNLAPLTK